jgi:hypothetical protein
MRYLIFTIAIILLASFVLPQGARAEVSASVIAVYAFDPGLGKQRELSSFTWPGNRQLCGLVRFSTSGYEGRKTVELFTKLTNRAGQVYRKYSAQLSVGPGEHEYIFPEVFRIDQMFISERYILQGEVKLAGGPRESKQVEVVLNGPAMPRVAIESLKLVDPKTDKPLKGVQPGQKFKITGAISIAGNTTKLLPDLVAWAVMSNDTLKSDPWTQDQFSDSYWDRATLNAPNGKWRFAIEGQAPEYFVADKPGSQPFMLHFAVEFAPGAKAVAQLGGTVNSGKGAFAISKDLELRLVRLERNWRWDVKTMR